MIKNFHDNNLKSILVSGLVLYAFLFDREPKEGRQMFTAANDKSQASIVFNMVAKQLMYFVSKVPELKKDVKKVRELLTHTKDGPYIDRKSTRLNSSHVRKSRMPSSA